MDRSKLNTTDMRIVKQFYKGKTLKRIAELIGRPGNTERIKKALERAEIPESRWYENEKET